MTRMTGADREAHMFVVPVFGQAEWLDRCLDSLQGQTVRSHLVVTTSTPNTRISTACEQRQIPLVVNPVSRGIAADWNFALTHGAAEWVTLAHQDDWYAERYVESCLEAARQTPDATLVFTDATERFAETGRTIANTRFKRILCALGFLTRRSIASRTRKRLLLSFGNPIPCSSVMINRRLLPTFGFPDGWRSNLDWSAWLALADQPGAFVYVPHPLVHRTLHANAATTRDLDDRAREDARMFDALWPWPIAGALKRIYSASRAPYLRLRSNG